MTDFSQQINNFVNRGIYNYQFDSVGNLILNPQSDIFQQNYFVFPLRDLVYNREKISSFYNPNFTEFAATTTASVDVSTIEMQQEIDFMTQQNVELQSKLDELLSVVPPDSTQSDQKATRDIIVELRIQLGQGKISSDFSGDFPYLPLNTSPS